MGRFYPFFIFCNLISFCLFAQEGDYYLIHHTPPDGYIDHINFSIDQDDNGFMWMANRKGVVQYDGQNWQLIPTSSAIFQVIATSDGIYASGRNIIGKIMKENSLLTFQPLFKADSIDDTFSLISFQKYLLFLSEHRIMVIEIGSDILVASIHRKDLDFNDIFEYRDRVIITTDDHGNFNLDEDLNSLAPFSDLNGIGNLVSLAKNTEGTYAALNDEGQLFTIASTTDSVNIDDNDYLLNSIPTALQWVDNKLMAISTLSGGVVFVNQITREYKITNFYSGLPENQVFAIAKDSENGIWVAHDYGFTRIMPLLPIRNYSNIPGVQGNILSLRSYNHQLYAGTTVGVFVLKKIPVYTEKVTYETITSTNTGSSPKSEPEALVREKKRNKKGLFGFLKKKKQKPVKPSSSGSSGSSKTSKTKVIRHVRKELESIRYTFMKIGNIYEETSHFIPLPTGLIAGGMSGIYEIQDTAAVLLSEEPVRFIQYSSKNNMLSASTFSNTMLSFRNTRNGWQETDILEGLEDFVYHITESGDNLWLSGADSIYRVELSRGYVSDVDVFPIDNPYFDETYIVEHEDRIIFINHAGFTYYNPENRKIEFDSVLTKSFGNPKRIFIGNDQSAWIFNGENWNILGSNIPSLELEFLNAFPSIRQLEYSAMDSTYWLVTFDNDIYGVKPKQGSIGSMYNVLLKEIRNNDIPLNFEEVFNVQQDENNLTFNFIQPDYSGMLGVEYRYRLSGLSDQWSKWSKTNNNITFSYLPPGRYQLELQTKNAYGKIDIHEPVNFNVVPPYWRRPWFYALEVLLFSTLLVVSIYLNRASSKYGILSRLLAFLTLILIVEFVQTIAEYKFETEGSPVFDFFIQVSIALLVLPVESLLRRAIFKKKLQELTKQNTK